MTTHTTVDSPLGELTIVADGELVTGLYFRHHWYRPDESTFGPRIDEGFDHVTEQLAEYFAGGRKSFDVRVRAAGDELQQAVWSEIAGIPYGETATYGEIAAVVGSDAREVGAAVGRNPLSILVACHRVVGKNGKLTGYAGGLTRKRFLLDLENPQLW